MSAINDGGPAFPVQDAASWQGHGMSLRDYFAAKVVQGICASGPGTYMTNQRIAKEAYELADAMLKAREEQQ